MPSPNDRLMYDLYGAGWEKEHPVLPGEDNCVCNQCLEILEEKEPAQGWVVPSSSRWHIDDVKAAIKGSEYEDKPMPSDEELMKYLLKILNNDYWVEQINEQLWMDLGDLFEKKEEE